ncbi:MAG TPA: mechanosensitive ion channel domain-containing protein [Chthoniobacteraceae bacterium]|nr:mechanosensitive ion channel domain-containing protein [Chthoniobacteraceae bacterium]
MLVWSGRPLAAQEPAESPAAATPAEVQPYVLSEAVTQLETTAAERQTMEETLAADRTAQEVAAGLKRFSAEIDVRARETRRLLAVSPSLERLGTMEEGWRKQGERLADWNRTLTSSARETDRLTGRLRLQRDRWKATLEGPDGMAAPADLQARIEREVTSLGRVLLEAGQHKNEVLSLQSRVVEQSERVGREVADIKEARATARGRLLERESPPMWRAEVEIDAAARAWEAPPSLQEEFEEVAVYALGHPEAFVFHAALFGLIFAVVRWARRRVEGWQGEGGSDAEMESVWLVLRKPWSTALLLSLLLGAWIYPDAPRLFRVLWGAAALVPAMLILRCLLEPAIYPILYALVALYFVDELRVMTAPFPFLSRAIFLTEMVGAGFFAWWMIRTARWNLPEGEGKWRVIRGLARLALVVFAVAFAANVVGYVRLSQVLGDAVLYSAYLAMVLYGGLRVVSGLVLAVFSFGPLTRLRVVERHRKLLWRRVRWWLRAGVAVLWVGLVLNRVALRDPVWEAGRAVFQATLEIGALHLSLANVTMFILTVWASFALSRLIRFVLDEEVYPRLSLARGVPYAVSTMLHYLVLLFGFFTAVSVLGFNLTQFTILAGAFGVGLGFGLQNIFNNFISGLILLFERPVKVGDVIVLDGMEGVVREIGIRASVIATPNGSDLIVPNGRLISERLTNWTYTNRVRGIEIPLSLPRVTEPQQVLDLLRKVAAANVGVAASPAPEAVFLKMAPSAEFELRVWTNHFEQWQKIRSDLTLAIRKALEEEGIATG